MWVQSLGQEDPLEKKMSTQSCVLAWRIPWVEEPGGLQFMGSLKKKTRLATSLTHSQINCYENVYTDFCMNINFHYSMVNVQKYWVLYWLDVVVIVVQSLSRVQLQPHGLQQARLP